MKGLLYLFLCHGFKIFIYSLFNFWLVGFWLVGVSVLRLDELAVGIVGGFLGDDGEAALHSLDDAGQIVDVVWQLAGLGCGDVLRLVVGGRCHLFESHAAMLSEVGECAAGVAVDFPHKLFFLFLVHVVLCFIGLTIFLTEGSIKSQQAATTGSTMHNIPMVVFIALIFLTVIHSFFHWWGIHAQFIIV